MKRRDLLKRLKAAGYREVRNDGGHAIFEKKEAALYKYQTIAS